MQQMKNKSSAALSRAGWESPPASPSPESRSPVSLFRRKLWRSSTEPGAVGDHVTESTMTDSRPGTREGPDVHVLPPTPPNDTVRRGTDVDYNIYDDADDEKDILDPRESKSGPATPTGMRSRDKDDIDSPPDLSDGAGLEM